MFARIDFLKASPKFSQKFIEIGQVLHGCGLPAGLLDLVHIRASQINGCAFCLDMHVKEAKIHGAPELKLYHVSIWRESPLFSAQERAALAWTEVVTRLPEGGIPDAAYAEAREAFSEQELADLTYAIALVNAWNRLNISFQAVPGSMDAMLGLTKAGLAA